MNVWCVLQSVKCVVSSVHVQFTGHFQVRVQCVMYTVQCAGCSVLPAKDGNLSFNPYGPELLESLKLPGGDKWPPPSELTNYNPNAKTDVTLYSQLLKLTI